MTCRWLFVFTLLLNCLASGAFAKVADVIIVIQRTAGATELYLSARADVLFELMGVTPAMFVGPDNMVDFATLQNGTSVAGDSLLLRTQIMIKEIDAGFEAMSLMAHPLSDKLPMTTPTEAMIAIGVCTGPPAGTFMALSALQAYVGYFTDVDSDGVAITLWFEAAPAGPYTFTVHEYDGGGHSRTYVQTLTGTGMLVLDSTPSHKLAPWAFLLFGLIAALAAARPTFVFLNTKPRSSISIT